MRDVAGHLYQYVSNPAQKTEPFPDDSGRWERFVSSVRSIPVLAESVYRLSNLLMVPPVDLAAVTSVLRCDLGLASQVLKLANSGTSDAPVHDLEYAMVHLGVDPLRAFILTVPVVPSDGPVPVLRLWEHAVQCAEVCAWLARKSQYEHQNRAYIAGLLHDLGRVPLIAWQLATEHNLSDESLDSVSITPEQEDERFGVNHQVIGGWMAVTWNFPDFLVEVLEQHHSRSLSRGVGLLQLVHAADIFCNRASDNVSEGDVLESLSSLPTRGTEQQLFTELCQVFQPGNSSRAEPHTCPISMNARMSHESD
jgi:HD-like signal output (HDOD) protein